MTQSPDNIYKIKTFVESTSQMPFKKRPQDGGFDFYVDLIRSGFSEHGFDLMPGQVVKLSTGTYCEFPEETVWFWDMRSSAALKGLDVCARTIDNPYRGELSIVLVNNSNEPVWIDHRQRVAQLIPNPFSSKYEMVRVESLNELAPSDRGAQGFGSSGK